MKDQEAKIRIVNLNMSIGNKPILKNINLEIPGNRLTVIIGPSGCGKTTLLKCLNRLTDLYPDASVDGNIFIGEEDILHTKKNVNDIRKQMGLLSQRPYPLPMNIYKNVSYGLRISGRRSKKYLDKRVEHYLQMVNLWDEVKDRLREPANRLSIGQQQRLCLARGLAVDPEFILADEPTSALDPISSDAIEKKFLELKSKYTIIMVTHILRQARRIADHVIFMYLGEVIEQGPADQFFNNPQEEKTKQFIKGAFN
jgi:phosphate transport system ATP-binding protein